MKSYAFSIDVKDRVMITINANNYWDALKKLCFLTDENYDGLDV